MYSNIKDQTERLMQDLVLIRTHGQDMLTNACDIARGKHVATPPMQQLISLLVPANST